MSREATIGDIHHALEILKKSTEAARAFQYLRKECIKSMRQHNLGTEIDGVIISQIFDQKSKKLKAIQLTRVEHGPSSIESTGERWLKAEVYCYPIDGEKQ